MHRHRHHRRRPAVGVIGCCVELVQVVPSEGAGCSALSLT